MFTGCTERKTSNQTSKWKIIILKKKKERKNYGQFVVDSRFVELLAEWNCQVFIVINNLFKKTPNEEAPKSIKPECNDWLISGFFTQFWFITNCM